MNIYQAVRRHWGGHPATPLANQPTDFSTLRHSPTEHSHLSWRKSLNRMNIHSGFVRSFGSRRAECFPPPAPPQWVIECRCWLGWLCSMCPKYLLRGPATDRVNEDNLLIKPKRNFLPSFPASTAARVPLVATTAAILLTTQQEDGDDDAQNISVDGHMTGILITFQSSTYVKRGTFYGRRGRGYGFRG